MKEFLNKNYNGIKFNIHLFKLAVETKNYEIFKCLCKNDSNIIYYLYKKFFLNKEILSFILEYENWISEKLIIQLTKDNRNDLLKIIIKFFKIYKFIDFEDEDGNNLLMIAYNNGNKFLFDYLLQNREDENFDINKINNMGYTALMMASKKEDEEAMKTLISCEANIKIKNINGNTALHELCKNKSINLENISDYLEIEEIVNDKNNSGITPLMYASKNGNTKIVEYLINKKANKNDKDNNGITPLMYACKKGNIKIVKYLIDKGAKVNQIDKKDNTAIIYACKNGNVEIVEYIIENGTDVDVNKKNIYGRSPLHYSCLISNEECIKYLINKNANINDKDNNGKTPLMYACEKGNIEIVKYLIGKGSEVNQFDKKKNTALIYACENGNVEIVEYIINKNANINDKNNNGKTPLMYACEKGNIEIVKYLIGKGANINDKDNNGITPLVYASENGNFEILKYLIGKGSEVNQSELDLIIKRVSPLYLIMEIKI